MRRHSARLLEPFSELFDWQAWLFPIGLALFLVFVSFHNYLLFHTAAELFAVVIGVLLCVVAWQTYPFSHNAFLMYLGCGYFWIAVLDGVHTLVYKGMTIFPITVANPATQFWIATRYSEALLLLTAPLFLGRAVARGRIFWGFGAIAVVLYALIMTGNFPDAFIEGQGLTPFKVASEYVIVALLAAALAFLVIRRALVEPRVFALLTVSILLTMVAELAFTFYVSVYGLSNLVGHIFKFFSFWLIFVAIVRQSLRAPYLGLEQRVEERTKHLQAEITERTQAEEALRESEEKFRNVVELGPDAVVILQDGAYRMVSPTFSRMFGYAQEDVAAGLNFFQLVQEHDREEVRRQYEGRLAGKDVARNFTIDLLAKDGTIVPCETSAALIEYEGRPADLVVIRDITERKQAEEALRERTSLLDAIVEGTAEAIFLKDIEGRYKFVNSTLTKMTGRSVEDIVGVDDTAVFPPETAREMMETDRSVIESKETKHFEQGVRIGNEIRQMQVTKSPYRDEDGNVIGVIGIGHDFTEHKRAEDAIRVSENRLKSVMNHAPTSVYLKDSEGRYLLVNDEFGKWTKATPEQAVGKTAYDFFSEDQADEHTDADREAMESATAIQREVELVHPDGTLRTTLVTKFPIFDAAGSVIGVGGINTDITERKRAEEALRMSEKRLRAVMDHSSATIVSVAGTTRRSRLDGGDVFLFSFPGPWQEFVDPVVGRFA